MIVLSGVVWLPNAPGPGLEREAGGDGIGTEVSQVAEWRQGKRSGCALGIERIWWPETGGFVLVDAVPLQDHSQLNRTLVHLG